MSKWHDDFIKDCAPKLKALASAQTNANNAFLQLKVHNNAFPDMSSPPPQEGIAWGQLVGPAFLTVFTYGVTHKTIESLLDLVGVIGSHGFLDFLSVFVASFVLLFLDFLRGPTIRQNRKEEIEKEQKTQKLSLKEQPALVEGLILTLMVPSLFFITSLSSLLKAVGIQPWPSLLFDFLLIVVAALILWRIDCLIVFSDGIEKCLDTFKASVAARRASTAARKDYHRFNQTKKTLENAAKGFDQKVSEARLAASEAVATLVRNLDDARLQGCPSAGFSQAFLTDPLIRDVWEELTTDVQWDWDSNDGDEPPAAPKKGRKPPKNPNGNGGKTDTDGNVNPTATD